LEGGVSEEGLIEEGVLGVAGLYGWTAGSALEGGFAGAEIEAGHFGLAVAGEAVGGEDLLGGLGGEGGDG
jgi:hypothetical protein